MVKNIKVDEISTELGKHFDEVLNVFKKYEEPSEVTPHIIKKSEFKEGFIEISPSDINKTIILDEDEMLVIKLFEEKDFPKPITLNINI